MSEKKEKNKGGRPPLTFTNEQLAQIEALSAFLTMEQIADYFGTTRQTLSKIMERQPEVSLRYKKGKTKAISVIGKSLFDQARGGNISAQIFYLKTRGGWKETQTVEVESNESNKIEIEIVDARKPEQCQD
ncbi:helix-turn-helix domain-containing protein [Pasteurella sp. PK-2025]|uniref:helix-turn-helix domain-containing protein n=1 Tax=Pasteurella sp. PK-2025 TaxID=3413133 RepID=UPI003C7802AE